MRRGRKVGAGPNPDPSSVVSDPVSALAANGTWEVDDRSVAVVDPSDAVVGPSGTVDDRSVAVGDRSARRGRSDFDTIFEQHYQRLVRALTLVAGDAETAADAVQEAFVKAHVRWRRIGKYDDPVGWIRRVAINQLRDDHRRRGRKQRALGRLASRHEAVSHPHELDEFDRLLAELPKQQRATTALFYVDGLTVAEIAVALGIAEGSVKSHLHDARKRLKPVLEREAGPFPEAGDRS